MLITKEKLFDIDEFLVSILQKFSRKETIRRMELRIRAKYEPLYEKAIDEWFFFQRKQILKGLSSFSKVTANQLTSKLTNWKLIEEAGIKSVRPLTLDIMQKSGEQAFLLGRIEGSFDVFNPHAVALANTITATMVSQVTKETQKGIAHIISTGIETGMTRVQIGKEIKPLIGLSSRGVKATQSYRKFLDEKRTDLTTLAKKKRYDRYVRKLHKKRAELIAHTETARAQAEGTLEGYVEGGVKKVEFNAAVDACPQCAPLDGQIYTVHDAQGLIPVHPAGRCTWMVPVLEARRPKKPVVPTAEVPKDPVLVRDHLGVSSRYIPGRMTPAQIEARKKRAEKIIAIDAKEAGVTLTKKQVSEMYDSLHNYSMRDFRVIRYYQRTGKFPTMAIEVDNVPILQGTSFSPTEAIKRGFSELKADIARIEQYLQISPKYNGYYNNTVYRAIKPTSKISRANWSNLNIGEIVDMDGISSWTSSSHHAETYFGDILFKINNNKTGVSITHSAFVPLENEIIFSNKIKFRIIKKPYIDKVSKTLRIEVEEIIFN